MVLTVFWDCYSLVTTKFSSNAYKEKWNVTQDTSFGTLMHLRNVMQSKGWYTRMCYACAAPLVCKLWTYFLKMCVCLDGTADTCHTVVATARGKPNFVGFYTKTNGTLCIIWMCFMFKIVFVNCSPDSSVKKLFASCSHQPWFVVCLWKINLLCAKDVLHTNGTAHVWHSCVY